MTGLGHLVHRHRQARGGEELEASSRHASPPRLDRAAVAAGICSSSPPQVRCHATGEQGRAIRWRRRAWRWRAGAAAPSVHRSGVRYQWVTTCKPAELPPALYDAIAYAPTASVAAGVLAVSRPGNRRAMLQRMRRTCRPRSVTRAWTSPDARRVAQRDTEQARECCVSVRRFTPGGARRGRAEPIASAAISAGLELGEVRATVSSAWRYRSGEPTPHPLEPKQRAALIPWHGSRAEDEDAQG